MPGVKMHNSIAAAGGACRKSQSYGMRILTKSEGGYETGEGDLSIESWSSSASAGSSHSSQIRDFGCVPRKRSWP
jgi:hypothetical protein